MKRVLYLLAILLTIVLGAYFQYHYCCNPSTSKSNVTPAVTNPVKDLGSLANFSLKDGNFSIKSDGNFDFLPSSFSIHQPISAKIQGTIGELKKYLSDKPNKYLDVKGYYADFEKNNSVFPNLGLARANAVKKYLVAQGLNGSRINIFGELTDKLSSKIKLFKGLASYGISTFDEEAQSNRLKDLKAFGENVKKNPIMLYFNTGESYINLSAEERSKIQKINEYLNQVKDSRLLIVGHTDNTGDKNNNKILGEKRAIFVKDYFVKNGFSSEKIDVESKGQEVPIATNETAEGKAKNRRVEVTIK